MLHAPCIVVGKYNMRTTSEFYQLKKEHFMHFHSSQSNQADLVYKMTMRPAGLHECT